MKLTLSKKLYGITGILLASLMIVSAITYVAQQSVLDDFRELLSRNVGQRLAVTDAVETLGKATQAWRNHVIRG